MQVRKIYFLFMSAELILFNLYMYILLIVIKNMLLITSLEIYETQNQCIYYIHYLYIHNKNVRCQNDRIVKLNQY